MPDESSDSTAASVAAARRSKKGAPLSTVRPGRPPAPVTDPSAPPVLEKLDPPEIITVSRSVVAEHLLRVEGPRMFGDATLYAAVITPGARAPLTGDYVAAACEAHETMIPPRSKFPVNRLLWRRGWLVRRDVYDAVMTWHAGVVSDGSVDVTRPAGLDVPAPTTYVVAPDSGAHVPGAPAPI